MGIHRTHIPTTLFLSCVLIIGCLFATNLLRAHADADRETVREASARNPGLDTATPTGSATGLPAPASPPPPDKPAIPPGFANGTASSSSASATNAELALAFAPALKWEFGGIGPFIKC